LTDYNANMQLLVRIVFFFTGWTFLCFSVSTAQTFNWTHQGPHPSTEGRARHATATIGEDKILLFGGESVGVYEGELQDTWVYDVNTDSWDQKSPSNSPSPRNYHAMAYIGDDKVVLYGGLVNNNTHFDDTWIYDLSDESWTLMNPPTYPTARCNHKLVYFGGDQVLLYGGYHGWGDFDDETWIYDLSDNSWTQKYPTSMPPPKGAYGMSYIGDDQVILFSGAMDTDSLGYAISDNETWIYDVSDNTWIKKSPSNVPLNRIYHDLAYIGDDQVLLFGGFGPDKETGVVLSDTWIYDLSANLWIELSNINPAPEAVLAHSISATKPIGSGPVVLFLGSRNRTFDDLSKETWLFDWVEPVITFTNNPPLNLDLSCSESTSVGDTGGPLTGMTDCITGGLNITYSDQITTGSCPQEYTITRTWTGSDNCGIIKNYTQIINVSDNTDPVIDCNSASFDKILYVASPDESVYLGAVDLGIGRIPVSTAFQAELVVKKIKDYNSPEALGNWRNITCFIAEQGLPVVTPTEPVCGTDATIPDVSPNPFPIKAKILISSSPFASKLIAWSCSFALI